MTARAQWAAARTASDDELVQQIAIGNLGSLGTLFDRYETDVRRLLSRLGNRNADIDDLVQGTFLQVIRAAPGFDPRFSVRSWLLGIAAIMARRHHQTIRRLANQMTSWTQVRTPPEAMTPGDLLDAREAEQRMRVALERLSTKRREAFVLVTLEGATGEEAAAALRISINTLWTRLHHARRDLRTWVLKEDP